MRREIKDLIRAAEARGWASERTNGGHVKLSLRKHIYFIAATPSDHRAIKNAAAALRRMERGAEK